MENRPMALHGGRIPRDRVASFCEANGIRRLALFGSILRDDFGPESDVDILVEFLPGIRVGYLAVARMARELSEMLGRGVDVRTPAAQNLSATGNVSASGDLSGASATLSGDVTAGDELIGARGSMSIDWTVGGQCAAAAASFDDIAVNASFDLPDCPKGYVRDAIETRFVLCTRGADEMVRVGDFWVDRYEASAVSAAMFNGGTCDVAGTPLGSAGGTSPSDNYPADFPDHGSFTVDGNGEPIEAAYACSIPGPVPSRMLTWFQAQVACGLAGKHLCTNDEWQMAAEGTTDPGSSNGAGGACVTGGSPRAAGQGTACRSSWGANHGFRCCRSR